MFKWVVMVLFLWMGELVDYISQISLYLSSDLGIKKKNDMNRNNNWNTAWILPTKISTPKTTMTTNELLLTTT